MNLYPDSANAGPHWSTACLSEHAGLAPMPAGHDTEPGALEQHLSQCLGRSRRLFVLRCGADSLHAFVVPRFISTLAVVVLLATLATWLL